MKFFTQKNRLTVRLAPLTRSGDEWASGWCYQSDTWCRNVTFQIKDPSGIADGLANAALPPSLLIGMLGPFEEVRIQGGAVCPRLYQNSQQAMALMADRFEEAHAVKFKASLQRKSAAHPEKKACVVCFTGGVDSLFSAWTLRDQCQGLLYVHGFDIPQDNLDLFHKVLPRLQMLAADLGLPIYTLSTDLRLATDCYGPWGKRAFGSALASMAHLLPAHLGGLVIPASYDLNICEVAGSMHDLDPLWSSAGSRVIHHGVETSRLDKIRQLAEWPLALKHLRVCWKNPENAYNCGHCEKCLRTLILLEMAGLSGRVESFDSALDMDAVAEVEMASSLVYLHWQQIHHMLEKNRQYDTLRRSVGLMLDRNRARLGLLEANHS